MFLICDQKPHLVKEESSEALGPQEQHPRAALMKKRDLGVTELNPLTCSKCLSGQITYGARRLSPKHKRKLSIADFWRSTLMNILISEDNIIITL